MNVPEFIKGLGSRFLEDLGVVPAVPAGAVERLDDFLIVDFLDPREEPGGRTVTIGIFGFVRVKPTDRRAGLVVKEPDVVGNPLDEPGLFDSALTLLIPPAVPFPRCPSTPNKNFGERY